MQTADQITANKKESLRSRLLKLFRLIDKPTIKVYNGYGHNNGLTVFGHVFRRSPFPRKTYRQSFLRNSFSLLRLFLIKPFPYVVVQVSWKGKTFSATTDDDGFFRFDWEDKEPFEKGWVTIQVEAFVNNEPIAQALGNIFIPYETQFIFISDIDDTFLISHSDNLRKRLYVLFTENARSRRPFEGVVRYYNLLAQSNTKASELNAFFYVSSSEWNLYDYIKEFTAVNQIPAGVFLLSSLKRFAQLLKTGQNNHGTKFTRIVRLLEAFPRQRVVLFGDSSQKDPYIYQSIVQHFPSQVHAVYIRDVVERNARKVKEVLASIETAGVPCLFFKHSEEAILHSVKIGLINPAVIANDKQIKPSGEGGMA